MKKITFKDLKEGQKVKIDRNGGYDFTEGVITIYEGRKYFVSDDKSFNGGHPKSISSKYDKKCAWNLTDKESYSSGYSIVVNMTAKEIEEYKDFQLGDRLIAEKGSIKGVIVFANEYVVSILTDRDDVSTRMLRREYAYKYGWRLDETPVEETPEIKEYTAAEAIKILAEKAGVDESLIRIKK